MEKALITTTEETALQVAGQAANHVAANHVFDEFRSRKSENTLRAHDNDLRMFETFLSDMGIPTGSLNTTPKNWTGVTWGIIEAFRNWMLSEGYSISSINRALSTVKRYATLALKSGAIDKHEHALIRTVTGYARNEFDNVDGKRETTRRANGTQKKAKHVTIPVAVAKQLKTDNPDTPQGYRDSVLMCLLIDHGLRCSEVAGLTVGGVNLTEGTITFNRPKVKKVQTHDMSTDLLKAIKAYAQYMPLSNDAPLLRTSKKSKTGELTNKAMATRTITKRVNTLAAQRGVKGVSAHDCRHYWATQNAVLVNDGKLSLLRLQEAGGWNSFVMPRRYIEAAEIANKGMDSV
jgi:site-specific recombinase XerD